MPAISAHPEMSHSVMISAENLVNRIRVLCTGREMDRNFLRGPRLIEKAGVCLLLAEESPVGSPLSLASRGSPREHAENQHTKTVSQLTWPVG